MGSPPFPGTTMAIKHNRATHLLVYGRPTFAAWGRMRWKLWAHYEAPTAPRGCRQQGPISISFNGLVVWRHARVPFEQALGRVQNEHE